MPGVVMEKRAALRQSLSRDDREYMVWQEWKEGFARLIENRIRGRSELAENHGGAKSPLSGWCSRL